MNIRDEILQMTEEEKALIVTRCRHWVNHHYKGHPMWDAGYHRYIVECVDQAMRTICDVK